MKSKKNFLNAFDKSAANISKACEKAGICRQTYYDWMEKDKKFAQAVEEINEKMIDFAESMLKKNIAAGDNTATIFFLKTKGKKRGYVERQEVDNIGEDHSRPAVIQIIKPGTVENKSK